jgi:predicted nuclease of predicted toxin-antitoxin system
MRIKLDENLPADLVADLAALGHDVDTVPAEGLAGHSDPTVWAAAQAAQRFLITQDLDFSDVRVFAPGTHQGLMLVRLREPSRSRLRARVLAVFRTEDVESWQRCLLVVSDRKVRIRRPGGT